MKQRNEREQIVDASHTEISAAINYEKLMGRLFTWTRIRGRAVFNTLLEIEQILFLKNGKCRCTGATR